DASSRIRRKSLQELQLRSHEFKLANQNRFHSSQRTGVLSKHFSQWACQRLHRCRHGIRLDRRCLRLSHSRNGDRGFFNWHRRLLLCSSWDRRLRRQFIVQVGTQSSNRRKFAEQLPESNAEPKRLLQHSAQLCQKKRVEAQFDETRIFGNIFERDARQVPGYLANLVNQALAPVIE